MDDNKIREQVHDAVQRHCARAGIQPNPYLAQRVLAAAHETGRGTVRRKYSFGLILALALMLLAVTAAAAVLLSVRQIVDEHAVPMAQQSAGKADYTAEEVSVLVQLAQENGIALSDTASEKIAWAETLGEGYAKDEFIKELAYSEFGNDMTLWTLEQQKWFDDALVAMGLLESRQKALPDDPETDRALAIDRAIAYLTKHYEIAGDLTDAAQYAAGVQYINGDADGEYPGIYWSVNFQPLTISGGQYWVSLNDDGEILGDSVRPGLSEDSTAGDVRDAYVNVYGTDVLWDQAIRQSFLATAKQLQKTNDRAYLCFMQTTYPDIPENAITLQEAYAIAAKQLGKESYRVFPEPLIGTDTNPVWKISMSTGEDNYSFEIDCITGEIRTQRLLGDGDYSWWKGWVLWEVSDEVEENREDASPSFG